MKGKAKSIGVSAQVYRTLRREIKKEEAADQERCSVDRYLRRLLKRSKIKLEPEKR